MTLFTAAKGLEGMMIEEQLFVSGVMPVFGDPSCPILVGWWEQN